MSDSVAELGDMFTTAALTISAGATIAVLFNDPESRTSRDTAAQTLDGLPAEDLARIERAATALADVAARLRDGRPAVIAGAVDPPPMGEIDA